MLESIRKNSKIVMILLFLLIIPSFIFVGIDRSYFTESSPTVARVDGNDIKQSDWDNAHRQESDRMRAEMPNLDPKLLDSPEAKYATLERMVRDRVLAAAAQKMHLATSDAQLVRTLQGIPAIAALRKPDGTLDADGYRALVAAQGMTPEGFEANLRRNLALNQVMGSVLETSMTTPATTDAAMDAVLQRREIQVALFNAEQYKAALQPSADEVKAYYDAHQALFRKPEQADIEYVVLDLNTVKQAIQLNEDDLRTYYKENAQRLAGVQEERRASHILINAPQSASAEERAKAKAKAEALLAEVRAKPETFAEVAKKESQDPGSAANGGDLGFFGRGAMVAPFEQAAFSLPKGSISDVVASDFGFHIIQVTDTKQPPVPSYEQLRPKIVEELQQQQAQRKYAEVADSFSNLVYEQADSLQPTADKLGLKVIKATGVQRTAKPGAEGPLANARFLETLFTPESLESKRNTEAVEFGTSQMVAGRITRYEAAHTEPLTAVEADVKRLWVADKAAELAKKAGEDKLTEWKADASKAQGLAAAQVISRNDPKGLPREVVDAALVAPVKDGAAAWTGVSLGKAGYAVVKVNKVVPNEHKDAEFARQAAQQYVQLWSSAEGAAYYETLKNRFKVQIKVPRP
ncbi:MAG: SurA N-terminal domain-containing protein [Comamonas sp.]